MENIIAAVDKFAGSIKINTRKTGTQRGSTDSLNVIVLSLIFDKYSFSFPISNSKPKGSEPLGSAHSSHFEFLCGSNRSAEVF